MRLKSVTLIKEFVADRSKDTSMLVLRAAPNWGLGSSAEIYQHPSLARNASFSTRTKAGQWLLSRLIG